MSTAMFVGIPSAIYFWFPDNSFGKYFHYSGNFPFRTVIDWTTITTFPMKIDSASILWFFLVMSGNVFDHFLAKSFSNLYANYENFCGICFCSFLWHIFFLLKTASVITLKFCSATLLETLGIHWNYFGNWFRFFVFENIYGILLKIILATALEIYQVIATVFPSEISLGDSLANALVMLLVVTLVDFSIINIFKNSP